MRKGLYMKKLLMLMLLLSVLMLTGCGSNPDIEWALQEPLKVGVDVAFEGDVLESGTYTFDVTNKKLGEATMWDVYVLFDDFTDMSDVIASGIEPITVGGVDSNAVDIDLESGNYVYIIPVELVYEPNGYLTISKK